MIMPVPAQEKPPEQPPEEPPWWKEEGFNGTLINWDKQHETHEELWNWLSQTWEFGPYPTFRIYLQNGTEVNDTNCIPLEETFTIAINVQKTIFTRNVTLGRAGLNWHTNIRSENGTDIGCAQCSMTYINEIITHYWNESNTWHVESSIFNYTMDHMKGEEGPPPEGEMPPPKEEKHISFYHFDEEQSNITETEEMWRIEIVGYFNSTTTPIGPFWVNLEITDSTDTWIDFGYVAWEGKTSPNRMVAVGKPGFISGGRRDTWTFEKLDMENNPIYSVSRGAPWKIRMNVTSSELVNITIAFELPWEVKTYVNITGWYEQTTSEYGGWMYNKTSGNYYWNSTVQVTQAKQVYGPHLEERRTQFDHGHEINVTRLYWDPETGEERNETFTEWVQDRMYLIYTHSNHSFSVKQGYSYWSYDPSIQRDREYSILNPLNTSDPTTRFYNLSPSDCTWNQTAPDEYVIEFVGSFSNTTYSDRNEYYINEPIVYSTYDRIWPDWETISPCNFQIAVDTLVAITTIIDQKGHEVKGWMFQTDPGDFFTIQSKLQGASVQFNDIDGVGVVFRTSSGRWVSENENYWSDIEIRLAKELTTGKLVSTTYNRTGKNVYVYGPHRGWELVNVTDWHQEYNAISGEWEWVESPRPMWNETIVTDWHWEYLSLNQTEYALSPNSTNVWINREEQWIPDDDPAFRTPSSYAVLNSANMSLIEGIVTVYMNVSFTENAPHNNYWWEMCFKNMTFGRDWSQGWGEHTVLEWTSESVYYVNGTATGGQPWFVEIPSTPFYSMYNGVKHRLEETPYITIGDENLLIKARTHYDWGRQEDIEEYMFWDQYDPKLGTEPRYYELINGTKIYVKEAYQAIIRTLKLNVTDAYRITDIGTIPVPNGTVFSTFMDHAVEDWSREYWDEELQQHVVPYYYELLNGTCIYKNDGFEIQVYNWTTYHWDLSNPAYSENRTTLAVAYLGHGITLNQTIFLLRDYGSWWERLPDGTGYYLVMEDGTVITHEDPWSVPDEQRIVTINGSNYIVDWPNEYYEGTHQGQTLKVRSDYVHNFYYTDLGISRGTKHELPYPGAMATSMWELERIESEIGRLRTFKSIMINGTKYRLHMSKNESDCYILVDGQRLSVTRPMQDAGYFYAEINGQEHWNIEQGGWILSLGTFSEKSGEFMPAGSPMTTITGYEPQGLTWSEHNRWGYDYENSTLYIVTLNGTRYNTQSGIYLIIWEVKIGNETFYTMDDHDNCEMMEIPETGEIVYKSYITTLNGTRVYFDWDRNQANWVEELHILVPGANYTKFIPFNWTNQLIFDHVYIFNITITEPGVFYEDGTPVPVGTTFKTFGTSRGPGTRGDFDYSSGHLNWAWLPGVEAPWNRSMFMYYFTTLDGSCIYSDHWGWQDYDQCWHNDTRWEFNGEPTTANITAAVVEGGYAIYLNNTIKVDVTTEWPQGGLPDQYLIMKNGTQLNVHWLFDVECYVTELNGKTYFFKQVLTHYNVTDSGVVYNIFDPFFNEPYRMLTPTVHIVPAVTPDQMAWLQMNSTSDMILHDIEGYYLINATDYTRINLELVDNWWNLSESIRRDVFRNEWGLENAYPRYSITINGHEYFVIDPSPVTDRWDGEHTIEWSIYRYPSIMNINLDGQNYTIALFEGSYWKPDLRWRCIETLTLSNGTTFEVQEQHCWKPYYEAIIDGQPTQIKLDMMNIYKKHTTWGEPYRWMLTDLQVTSMRSIGDIIVGTPECGMWGMQAFGTVPETGAVDLDGDLATVDDQYFVRRLHSGSDIWNRTEERMFVEIVWDPNASRMDDEIHIGAWMGKVHTEWSFTWNETYIWYYASNMSIVSHLTMQQINTTLVDSETGLPNPGYWNIAHMAKNSTWADLLSDAEKKGWDWIDDNKHEWDWLWFGTEQDYVTAWSNENGTKTANIGLRYEFAGLSLFNSTEQTHFFMPENINNITFVSPGEALGNMNATGEILAPLNQSITFGVSFENVTGTLFPYKKDRSMWGWWDGIVYGADFEQPNFMNKPTRTTVNEMAFTVHFSADATEDSMNNNASMKIDQHIGNWEINPQVIDGRKQNVNNVSTHLTGKDVFLNRSLAINYYVTAFTDMVWDVVDDKNEHLDNNNVTESSTFNVAARLTNASFASVKLGSTYDWHKPVAVNDTIRTFNVTSKTTPIKSFEASFESDAGKSSAGFEILPTMYFLTVEFPRWDGYAVYNDPELVFFASQGTSGEGDTIPPEIGIPSRDPGGDVMPNQPVKVSVSVTDAGGVKNVTLSYTTNDDTWTNMSMEYNPANSLYEVTILGQPSDTLIKYVITAYDNAENPAVNNNAGEYHVYSIIPEFPSAMIPLLLIALAMVVIVFSKEKRSHRTLAHEI